jgi:hypothetical protein
VKPRDLSGAPLEAVFLYGLVGDADADPLDTILSGLRSDLEVAARLAGGAGCLDHANSLDGWRNRLEVALELRRREVRARNRKPRKRTR